MSIMLEIIVILLLILLNGYLAMAEIAIVAARKSRLESIAEEGDMRAEIALKLSRKPTDFLSTVQIGITMVGILAGVFGGATIADQLADGLARFPLLAPYSGVISVVMVVLVITYFTLVLGELVPKSFALTQPETISIRISRSMHILAKVTAPLVRLLSSSTRFILALFKVRPVAEAEVTESEILALIEQGTLHGALLTQEQRMLEGVLNLADRRIDSLMVPRIEIERLDIQNSLEENRRIYLNTPFTHLPVEKGSIDHIIGVVSVQELLKQEVSGDEVDIEKAIQDALFVPENVSALKVLNQMRENKMNLAIVIDEFSGTQGMVTVIDILEGIVGDIPTAGFPDSPEIMLRPDGTYLIDGLLPVDEFRDIFSLEALPDEDRGSFQTVSGFVMSCLGRIPAIGDTVDWEGIRIEVVDMDGFRIDKVIVHPPGEKVD